MRRLVFVCGPLRSANPQQVEAHRMTAMRAALDLATMGLAPYCPHANLSHGLGVIDETDAEAVNLSFLRLADALLRLPGWGQSVGSRHEIQHAVEWGIPIFDSLKEVKAWAGRRR